MAWRGTAVSPLLTHWRCCGPALGHDILDILVPKMYVVLIFYCPDFDITYRLIDKSLLIIYEQQN